MDLQTTIQRFIQLVVTGWKRFLWPWLKSRSGTILTCVVLGIVAYLAFAEYQKKNTHHIQFYVGQSGGANSATAREVQQELLDSRSIGNGSMQIDIKSTGGYRENYLRIQEDLTGQRVAFTYDGVAALEESGDAENVQILVPLHLSYVHVIAKKAFVDRHIPLSSKDSLRELAQAVAKRFESDPAFSAQFYLDDKNSATRILALRILEQCGLDHELVEATTIRDIEDVRSKFKRNELDVAFYTGPMFSKFVEQLAATGDYYLIGLRDTADVLHTEYPFLQTASFLKNAYVTTDDAFCSGERRTLSMRKVVVCSSHMKPGVAYALGKLIKTAVSRIGSPSETEPTFSFKEHVVAENIRTGDPPTQLPSWVTPVWPILAFLLIGEVIKITNGFLSQVAQAAPAEGADSDGARGNDVTVASHQELHSELESIVEAWGGKELGRNGGKERLRKLRGSILQSVRGQRITDSEAATLLESFDELWDKMSKSKRRSRMA